MVTVRWPGLSGTLRRGKDKNNWELIVSEVSTEIAQPFFKYRPMSGRGSTGVPSPEEIEIGDNRPMSVWTCQ